MTPPPVSVAVSYLRPLLALLAGLGITVLTAGLGTVIATLAMLRDIDPKHFQPTSGYLATTLAISFFGSMGGGFATSRITAGRSLYTLMLLALVLLVSGLAPVIREVPTPAGQPAWYPLVLAVIGPVGALVGGLLERRSALLDARRTNMQD